MTLNLKWLPRINYAVYIVFQGSMYSTVFTMLLISICQKHDYTHFNKHSRGCYAKPLFGKYMVNILLAQASAEPWQNLKLAFRLFIVHPWKQTKPVWSRK